jgi:glycosyltransferase involved in cell wall biosynthesis
VEAVIHGGDARLFRRLPKALQWRVLDDLWDRQYTLRFVAEALRQDFGALTQHRLYARSRVEPCALEVRRELTRAEARQRLSIGADEFLALVVGRLVPSKRVAHALAVPRAPKQCRWVVLGDGPELSRLRREFPHVAFLGRVDRETVLNWLQAADVLVSASLSEGAPSAIREARALGVRVWAHPAGDIAAWAQHDNGIELLQ